MCNFNNIVLWCSAPLQQCWMCFPFSRDSGDFTWSPHQNWRFATWWLCSRKDTIPDSQKNKTNNFCSKLKISYRIACAGNTVSIGNVTFQLFKKFSSAPPSDGELRPCMFNHLEDTTVGCTKNRTDIWFGVVNLVCFVLVRFSLK